MYYKHEPNNQVEHTHVQILVATLKHQMSQGDTNGKDFIIIIVTYHMPQIKACDAKYYEYISFSTLYYPSSMLKRCSSKQGKKMKPIPARNTLEVHNSSANMWSHFTIMLFIVTYNLELRNTKN